MAALRGCVASSSRSASASTMAATHKLLRSSVAPSARASSSSTTLQHTPSSSSRRAARFSTSASAWQPSSTEPRLAASDSIAPPPLSATGSNPALTPHDTTEQMQQWYRRQYPAALALPDDVLIQTVTHESWDMGMGKGGHNRRLAFLGRRAMHLYLSLFLHSQITQGAVASSASSSASRLPPASASTASQLLSSEETLSKLLQTSRLGDSVGRSLKLEQVMRWRPAVSDGQAGPKEIGLFKIRGTVVESLVGAIYHQHGAAAARAFFHARVLPNIEAFEAEAKGALQEAIAEEARLGKDFVEKMVVAEQPAQGTPQVTPEVTRAAAIEEVKVSEADGDAAAQRSRAFDAAGAVAGRGLSTRSSSSARRAGGNVVFDEAGAEEMATAGSRA